MAISLTKRVSRNATSIISLIALLVFLPLLLVASLETARLISRATGTKATIVVDTQNVLGHLSTNFYHAFAQGGEESTDMLAPIVNELKSLRPRLIRLDHLYDHYAVVGRSGNDITFDFSRLDTAVDTIVATGAKPLLALSFMPSAIARDGNIINPPNNWEEWALVVQKTIEHFSGRGNRNMADIYYEVWNEPDLDQFGKWQLAGDKNYLTLYRFAASGANRAQNVNRFFLGGPATTGLYQRWILTLATSGLRLDFLSWHSYLEDPNRYNEDEKNLVSWLLPYPNKILLPKLITEFGFTGGKDKRYGTTYASAYTAAAIRQMITGGPTYAFAFQPKDGPGQESGNGWGFITHESNGKRPKPRYYVFSFLDAMAGERLALTGEGSWVTGFASQKEKTIRVLLVNFDREGNHTENVPVTFTNLTPGTTYVWRERFLLGRDVSFPAQSVTESSLTRQVFMPPESVAILELTAQ